MKDNLRLYFASLIITLTVMTGILLMPFAEYNSSKYISGSLTKMTEISLDENTLTVGIFGEKLSLPAKEVTKTADKLKKLTPLLPNELRVSAVLIEKLFEYIGEAV